MTRPEFEEKAYEIPLCMQLFNSRAIFSPGQVFESLLGFDVAGLVADPAVWRRLGYRAVPSAVRLSTFNLRSASFASNSLPSFPINLLLQTKRPSSLVRVPAPFRGNLSSPHYRIVFEGQQHSVLSRLQRRLASRGVVAYATPVFCDWRSLYDRIQDGRLVQNSSFPSLKRVARHTAWLYDRPGCIGFGHSAPEFIEDADLFGQIERARHALAPDSGAGRSAEAGMRALSTDTYERLGRLVRDLYIDGVLPFSRESMRPLVSYLGRDAATYFLTQVTFIQLGLVWAIA